MELICVYAFIVKEWCIGKKYCYATLEQATTSNQSKIASLDIPFRNTFNIPGV